MITTKLVEMDEYTAKFGISGLNSLKFDFKIKWNEISELIASVIIDRVTKERLLNVCV